MGKGKVVTIVIVIVIIIWLREQKYEKPERARLEKDGFEVVKPSKVLERLPEGYKYIDYEYKIDGCTLSTFHRDVTSSKYEFKTKHPVYTYIMYEYKGEPLTVCPGSNKTVPYVYTTPKSVDAKWVLFDCDLIHAGSLNPNRKPRKAVQYKIAHEEDIPKLKHLEGINKRKVGDCKKTNKKKDWILRKLSLLFAYPINHIFTSHLQNRQSEFLCKLVGEERCFYNK